MDGRVNTVFDFETSCQHQHLFITTVMLSYSFLYTTKNNHTVEVAHLNIIIILEHMGHFIYLFVLGFSITACWSHVGMKRKEDFP